MCEQNLEIFPEIRRSSIDVDPGRERQAKGAYIAPMAKNTDEFRVVELCMGEET